MATGIQTGMRTGPSRVGATAGRGASGKAGFLGQVKEWWAGRSKAFKLSSGVILVTACLALLMFGINHKNNAPVELYSAKMTRDDVMACAAKLTELNISHNVKITEDNITLNPKDRARAQALLAQNGLPHHPVQTEPEGGSLGKTRDEARAMRERVLEGQVTETLRQMEGVGDAYVKIARPEPASFIADSKPTQANVMLKLKPGVKLQENQVKAVVHLVSHSIPELDQKNVRVVDSQMNDLTALLEENEDGSVATSEMVKLEQERAERLRKQAQTQLDQVLGQGKSKVVVNIEMDYAQRETMQHAVGGPGHAGEVTVVNQEKIENYSKNPGGNGGSESAQPLSDIPEEEGAVTGGGGGTSGKSKNNNYELTTRARKTDYNKTDTKVVQKSPEIRRISASVLVDNLKPDVESKILGMVGAAIGIEESRGDIIQITSLPFSRMPLLELSGGVAAGAAAEPAGFPAQPSQGIQPQMIGLALFGPAVLLLGLISVYLMKQHRVQAERSNLHLGSNHGGTVTDIADLLTDKSGKVTTIAETKVNTSDALEKLVKERPTKVAEMLKSTWLSG